MKFAIYQGEFRLTCMGYADGTPVRLVWEGAYENNEYEDAPPTPTCPALGRIWTEFQRVDDTPGPNYHMPPDGFQGRSLSVGDVIRLENEIGHEWFAVENIGFRRTIEPPLDDSIHVNGTLAGDPPPCLRCGAQFTRRKETEEDNVVTLLTCPNCGDEYEEGWEPRAR